MKSKKITKNQTEVGNIIRKMRQDSGKSIAQVCLSAKISKPYLMDIEKGRVKNISFSFLSRLIDCLDGDKSLLFKKSTKGNYILKLPVTSTAKMNLAEELIERWDSLTEKDIETILLAF